MPESINLRASNGRELAKLLLHSSAPDWNRAYKTYIYEEFNRLYPYKKNSKEWHKLIGILGENKDYRPIEIHYSDFEDEVKELQSSNERDLSCKLLSGANLTKINFTSFILDSVDFRYSNLKEACFRNANLSNSTLSYADIEGACFHEANLSNVGLKNTKMKKTIFTTTIVDTETLLCIDEIISSRHLKSKSKTTKDKNAPYVKEINKYKEYIDENTDFTGVPLSQMRIDPAIQSMLEKNIRKIYWEAWYSDHCILKYPVICFWYLSDYGTSFFRAIIAWAISLLMMYVYLCEVKGAEYNLDLIGEIIIAQFGGGGLIGSYGCSPLILAGYILITYFLLAVIVSRLSIMFQSLSR